MLRLLAVAALLLPVVWAASTWHNTRLLVLLKGYHATAHHGAQLDIGGLASRVGATPAAPPPPPATVLLRLGA